MKEKKSKRS